MQHAIRRVAALYGRKANGQHVGVHEWRAAANATNAAGFVINAANTATKAAAAAAAAAYAAYATFTYAPATATAALAATAAAFTGTKMSFTHQAIDAWERIMGTKSPTPTSEATESAVAQMLSAN
jgi:hypothetical protein